MQLILSLDGYGAPAAVKVHFVQDEVLIGAFSAERQSDSMKGR